MISDPVKKQSDTHACIQNLLMHIYDGKYTSPYKKRNDVATNPKFTSFQRKKKNEKNENLSPLMRPLEHKSPLYLPHSPSSPHTHTPAAGIIATHLSKSN